ncbi:hypothetical protein [Flavobacterium sp.]|uniref:LVIVD repeat-containing protein n=1 Tax=Flavobacterium sp. TaxID=239 RepID=UPI0026184A80|nr:hypothetical protein [Flavobacterium sp.]
MKKMLPIISAFVLLMLCSCSSDDDRGTALFAVPIVKSLSEIRGEITVSAARQTNSDGKIYVAEHYLFYIAKEQGIHIFNNENPAAPVNMAFINLEGVHDIAVKGHYLYADNFVDLVVFDIADINNISLVRTVPNSVEFSPVFPTEAAYYDVSVAAESDQIITGYRLEMKNIPDEQNQVFYEDAMAEAASGGVNGVGTGGSYAKFQINDDALYTVDNFSLNVFNITDPELAAFDKKIYMQQWFGGGMFETLFKRKDFLFIGSTSGMFVVDASDEFNPVFISGFSHATACDPVVVNENLAYITVRGGTTCGAIEDQVNVIDISDINNPSLISTTLLHQPYGLGIKGQTLFVCCGNEGLKVFDATDSSALSLQNTYPGNLTDVIPMDSHLIAVGPNKIVQYAYGDGNTLDVISTVNF